MPLFINRERVADSTLDREVLRLSAGLLEDAPEAGGVDPAHLRSMAARNVVDRTLLLQAARDRGIEVSAAETEAELARRWQVERSGGVCDPGSGAGIREDLLLDRITADLIKHVPRPGRVEAEHFYRANPHLYRATEAVEAAHILREVTSPDGESDARVALEQAEAELRKGKPFAQVADRWSACKGVGGTVGWVARGQMVQEFEDVVFALQPGRRSEIFRTVFGLHIATVMRRRRAGVTPFDDVRQEIARQLFADAKHRALQQVLSRLRAGSEIHYTEDAPSA